MKLFSIRPGSLFTQIGLQNGDIVRRINGTPMASPEAIINFYVNHAKAKRFQLELTRKGAPLTFQYALVG